MRLPNIFHIKEPFSLHRKASKIFLGEDKWNFKENKSFLNSGVDFALRKKRITCFESFIKKGIEKKQDF